MGRSYLTVDVEKLESKEDAEAKKRLLEADAHDISVSVGEWESQVNDISDDEDSDDSDEETEAEKLERKAKRFEAKKEKLQRRANNGKVGKLERKMKKYQKKVDKAKEKGMTTKKMCFLFRLLSFLL